MKAFKQSLVLLLLIMTVLTGCSNSDVETDEVDTDEVDTAIEQAETMQEEVKPDVVEQESVDEEKPTEMVSEDVVLKENESIIDEDIKSSDEKDYTYLTLLMGADRADVIAELGDPTLTPPDSPVVLEYDDFVILLNTETRIVQTIIVKNGDLLGVVTGMNQNEVKGILGEPHMTNTIGNEIVYQYSDGNARMIGVAFKENVVSNISYVDNVVFGEEVSNEASREIGDFIHMTENGLVLRTVEVIENGRYLTGIVENISDQEIRGVEIKFAFYDASGNILSQDYAYLSALEPHGTWKYKIVTDDEGTSYKFIELKSF